MGPTAPRAETVAPAAASRHPRGLYTLFFTEMWERCSYYGMRALLILFMVDAVRGGLGLTDKTAAAIYGLFTATAYLAALPGGWVADRFLGAQRSVWYGGIMIALGDFTLAIPRTETFFLGLFLIVLGTGLLKPNVSAMVGELYPEGGSRRDAGFSIFYMGINLGAAIGPLICSPLGEKVNWRYGFAAPGVGMILGLIQYRLARKHLGEAGKRPGRSEGLERKDWLLLFGGLGGMVAAAGLILSGVVRLNPLVLAQWMGKLIVGVAILYFVIVFLFFKLSAEEKKRVAVIAVLFLASAVFWSGLEQAGSSLNLFAGRYTIRVFAGHEIAAGLFQSLAPVFVISLAPVMAWVWMLLAKRKLDPPLAVKFALGLVLLGIGFLVMAGASGLVAHGDRVWPTWLIATYLFHSIGELCLSPVGLSSVTKLAPRRLVGQMMGVWFLATSLGNLIAGLIAGTLSNDSVQAMPGRFFWLAVMTAGTALLLLVFAKPIRNLMVGVK